MVKILRITDEAIDDLLDMINNPKSHNIRTISGEKTDDGVKINLIGNDESTRTITINLQTANEIKEALDNPPQPERLLERARQRRGVIKNCDVEEENRVDKKK